MKALITDGKGNVRVENDVPEPIIGDYDCLVKIESCLFCNSTDRHIVENTFNFGVPYPAILGHESIGVIRAVGAKARNLKVGDRVVRPYAMHIDETLGEFGSGWGGFAELGKVRDGAAMRDDGHDLDPDPLAYQQVIPADIPLEKARLISCQKEMFSASKKIPEPKGKRFLVAGGGVAGCLFTVFLKMFGADRVTLVARRREQREFAAENTPVDDVLSMDEAAVNGPAYDALVETTGSPEVLRRLAESTLEKDGVIHSYAVYEGAAEKGFYDQFAAIRRFERVGPAEASCHQEVCELIRSGKLDCSPFISHSFPMDDAVEAWKTVAEKRTMKTAVAP